MIPIDVAMIAAEAKQQDHIEEKSDHKNTPDLVYCSCVAYTKTKRPDIPLMDASRFTPATTTPFVGAVAVLYYPHSGMHHLAYVEEIGDGYIILSDSNYKPCQITRRKVALPDRILGYL